MRHSHAEGVFRERAFVALDDLSTESGKTFSKGYMQIAGAMVGIRNPKAHANLNITKEQCMHLFVPRQPLVSQT